MTNFVTSLGGANNGVQSTQAERTANNLKVYAGEVITAFKRTTVTLGRHTIRTIMSGKSAQFPKIGREDLTNEKYHKAGDEVDVTGFNSSEETVVIDDKLYLAKMFDDLDEQMTHFDYRNPVSTAVGEAMAVMWDVKVLTQGILGAREASNAVIGLEGGTIVTEANFSTDANAAVDAIIASVTALQGNFVTDLANTFCYLDYADYNNIMSNADKITNKDFTVNSNGGIDVGLVGMVAGIKLVPTNNLPSTNITGTHQNRYNVNASTTKALVMHKSAVGTVQLLGLKTEHSRENRNQGDLMVSSVARGTKWLRPEALVEIRTGTPV